jgi:flavin reductase (DIM6/NTAB) family NADH-FMN oxidoreductase RutF
MNRSQMHRAVELSETDGIRAEYPSAQAMRFATAAFPTGVAFVAAEVDGVPVGLLANSFTSVSLEPPLVSINIARTSTSWPLLRSAARLGISILSEKQGPAFHQLTRKGPERFLEMKWQEPREGELLLHGASATFTVTMKAELDAGDHVVVLLRVLDLERLPHLVPLIFYGSHLARLAPSGDAQTLTSRVLS